MATQRRIKKTIYKEKTKQKFQNRKDLIKGKTENKDEKLNLILSYLGNESISFTRRLMRIIQSTKINIGIIIKKHKTIGQEFSQKMKGRDPKKTGVVYSIECKNCDKMYVGQTGQDIETRVNQHKETLKSKQVKSSGHSNKVKHTFNFEEPYILVYYCNERKREIKETLLAKKFSHWALNEISFNNNIF